MSSSGRTRSFGGCATCRQRRMKCDEGRPTCLMCKSAGLKCAAYEKNIFFDFENASDASAARFRRPLLTVKEREHMSRHLCAVIPPRTALRQICQIDEQCDNASAEQEISITRGPFGVFRPVVSITIDLQEDPSMDSNEEPCNGEDAITCSSLTDGQSSNPRTTTTARDERPVATPKQDKMLADISQTFLGMDQYGEYDQTELFDLWDVNLETEYGLNMILDGTGLTDSLFSNAMSTPAPNDVRQLSSQESPDQRLMCSPQDNGVPTDAVFLLKHYSTRVVMQWTPFRHCKTPWHILFIPYAKNCLAALTLSEKVDDASLCNFYAILGISAYSMGGISGSQTWLDRAQGLKERARGYVKCMLESAYKVPKTTKYKSILMALLTMVHLSIVSGNQDQTECYLLETEKFIRLRGLNRRKSRKVRLLHHCYAFERICHESTFIYSANAGHRRHVRKTIESSGLSVQGQDNLSFRLGGCSNLEEAMCKAKGHEEGENDLHLQTPGIWAATLYPEIFGVPEQWVLLLSLIIRLGKERDAQEQNHPQAQLGLKDFLAQSKALERCIANLHRHAPTGESNIAGLFDVMQHALAIYFYRRIYDVDPTMLQTKVRAVWECLSKLDDPASEHMYGAGRLMWPAFIAASEAQGSQLQDHFAAWFKKAAEHSGLRIFSDVLATLERLWVEQRSMLGETLTWLDLLRREKMSVLEID